jgi:hypothetical protein
MNGVRSRALQRRGKFAVFALVDDTTGDCLAQHPRQIAIASAPVVTHK